MTAPKSISVIVPCFNSERTIIETLDSILDQSLLPHEIIIVDDGSTDESLSRVKAYVDRSSYKAFGIISQENCGVSAARNAGARQATGAFLCFLDADDLWSKEKLHKQYQRLLEADGSGRAVCVVGVRRFLVSDSGEKSFYNDTVPAFDPKDGRSSRIAKVLSMRNNEMAVSSTFLCLRDVFFEVGAWNETLAMAEDWDILCRLCEEFPLTSVNEPLLLYRKHSSSVTAKHCAYQALEYQQRTSILHYGQRSGLDNSVLRIILEKHYFDFLGISREAATWSDRAFRFKLLLALARLAPLNLFSRRYYSHWKASVC